MNPPAPQTNAHFVILCILAIVRIGFRTKISTLLSSDDQSASRIFCKRNIFGYFRVDNKDIYLS